MDTPNASRYRGDTDQVLLNPQGLPVAFRECSTAQPGSFLATHYELVTPRRVTAVTPTAYRTLRDHCTALN